MNIPDRVNREREVSPSMHYFLLLDCRCYFKLLLPLLPCLMYFTIEL
ncbi:rCG62952 [Rattus norvegicus]|uniref:RCG62952 n=1 Tax=Rattus norvegicus TaxID=10116 RepID=A6JPJ0_RAT|nr:rCG62952 [Rattus norvegicus]